MKLVRYKCSKAIVDVPLLEKAIRHHRREFFFGKQKFFKLSRMSRIRAVRCAAQQKAESQPDFQVSRLVLYLRRTLRAMPMSKETPNTNLSNTQ